MKTDNEMITRYEGLVKQIASQYLRVGEPMDDMMQDGRIGLLWAAEHYQTEWKMSFESYAAASIRHEICRALKEHGYVVSVPRRVAEETDHHPVVGMERCPEMASEGDSRARYEELYAAIDKLTVKQREVILELYGLEGRKKKSVKRLARKMGVETCSVYDMQERTLNKLRKLLVNTTKKRKKDKQ